MTVSGTATRYDPFGPDFQADPFAVYRWMRDEAPVYYSEKWSWWALSRFEDVRAAVLDPETYRQLRGHRHRRHREGPERRPGSCPTWTTRATTRSAGSCSRTSCRAGSPSARTASAAVVREPDRRLAGPRRGRPGPGAGLADAQRGVLRPARACPTARGPESRRRTSWSAGCTSSRTASPTTPGSPRWPRRPPPGIQDYFIDLLNERRRHRRDDLVTHLVRSRDRRRAVRRRGHRRRLGDHRA